MVDRMRPAIMGDRTPSPSSQPPSPPSKGHQPPQFAWVTSPLSATFCQLTWLPAQGQRAHLAGFGVFLKSQPPESGEHWFGCDPYF